jgi:MFS family permease
LVIGLLVLLAADLVLAFNNHWSAMLGGVALWGIHLGITQGLLARMIADVAPPDLRGTAFGFFNLMSGLAMLLASVVAGVVWEKLGASYTFYAGGLFCVLTLVALIRYPSLQINQN